MPFACHKSLDESYGFLTLGFPFAASKTYTGTFYFPKLPPPEGGAVGRGRARGRGRAGRAGRGRGRGRAMVRGRGPYLVDSDSALTKEKFRLGAGLSLSYLGFRAWGLGSMRAASGFRKGSIRDLNRDPKEPGKVYHSHKRIRRKRLLMLEQILRNPGPITPKNNRVHVRNPNKGPRFLSQVPTLAIVKRILRKRFLLSISQRSGFRARVCRAESVRLRVLQKQQGLGRRANPSR